MLKDKNVNMCAYVLYFIGRKQKWKNNKFASSLLF